MLFSSPFFIFIFFPLFLLLFFGAGKHFRDRILLIGSLSFYLWGEPTFCIIALLSALLDFWLGQKIFHSKKEISKRYVAIGVMANLSLLIYYKYTNFFISTVFKLFPEGTFHFELFSIILPIGVSFIVFEKITYLVDLHRGKGLPAKNLLNYLNYVFLFPKLLAGPIIKYHEIEKQLYQRTLMADDVAEGFKRFLRGLIKKVFFADTLGTVANQAFGLSQQDLGFGYAWLGIICFTLQIYFDFSGYSDMALGLARMMGFHLKENFNMPYIASSFTEFWRRWHISLSTWIREYLYVPLGGNQVTPSRTYVNLWICFLLSGLWHGANWTFVLWGAYNGFFLIIDKLIWLKVVDKIPRLIAVVITFIFIMLGWILFRANNFSQMGYYLKTLFNPYSVSNAFIDITPDIYTAIFIGSLLAFASLIPGYQKISQHYLQWHFRLYFEGMFYGVIGFLMITKMVGISYNPFLYFRF